MNYEEQKTKPYREMFENNLRQLNDSKNINNAIMIFFDKSVEQIVNTSIDKIKADHHTRIERDKQTAQSNTQIMQGRIDEQKQEIDRLKEVCKSILKDNYKLNILKQYPIREENRDELESILND